MYEFSLYPSKIFPSPRVRAEPTFSSFQLAIVTLSDQYTRIVSGGSPLETTAPVVGLLFGKYVNDCLHITDADDIPTDGSDAAAKQVALHQAVFPQHSVVGWYRVSLDEEPTASDLLLTQQLKQHYGSMLFALLQVPSKHQDLPLAFYRLSEDSSSTHLQAVEEYKLETAESERIAVERVIREQPLAVQESPYCHKTQEVQHSLQAIQDRMQVLIEYLQKTKDGTIPFEPALMRQVQTLLSELGPLAAACPSPPPQENLPLIAVLAKTVQAVHTYTDKFRVILDSQRPMATQARGGQRVQL